MHRMQQQWTTVTTATRPSHEYVTATAALYTRVTTIEQQDLSPGNHTDPARRINVDQALADQRYTATDLSELTHTAALLPEPFLRAGLLFTPARILPSTMERLHDRSHGSDVAIQVTEGAELIDAAQKGSSAARAARATLELSWQSAATTERAQTLAARSSSQEHEPITAPLWPRPVLGRRSVAHSAA